MSEQPESPAPEHHPHFGFTKHGLPVHLNVADYHAAGGAYGRLNRKIALWVTSHVFTMTCFWIFNILALLSLPATLKLAGFHFWLTRVLPAFVLSYGFIFLVTWVCQNYIQLVLLPAIGVGQQLQNLAADARSAKQFEDLEQVKDWLDTRTQGGLTDVLKAVEHQRDETAMLAASVQAVLQARSADQDAKLAAAVERTAGQVAQVHRIVMAAAATAASPAAGSAGTAGKA